MQTLAYALIVGSAAAMVLFLVLAVRSTRGSDKEKTYKAAAITTIVLLIASLVFSLLV
ncbi:hypothetical protein [Streptomyces sp. A1277]|uniref:hypothetical protein n=1 Tax=Streptomyces sp. A1277 TaxID=2563103 RepID=UPI0014479436|nr:hypothetical protein [Streptomyces sp. A1277]